MSWFIMFEGWRGEERERFIYVQNCSRMRFSLPNRTIFTLRLHGWSLYFLLLLLLSLFLLSSFPALFLFHLFVHLTPFNFIYSHSFAFEFLLFRSEWLAIYMKWRHKELHTNAVNESVKGERE